MKAEAEMNDDQAEVNSRRSRKGGRRRTRALTSEMGGSTSRAVNIMKMGQRCVYIMHLHFTAFQVIKWGVGCMIETAEAREDASGRMRLAREVKMTRACSKVKGCLSSTMSEQSTKHHRHSKWVEVKMKNVKLMPGVDVMMTRRRGNHEGNIVDAAPIV